MPVEPLASHLGFRDSPVPQGLLELMSASASRIGEGSAKLSPDFPCGVVRPLLVNTLPGALGLDRFQVAIVDGWINLIALGIGDV